MATIFTRGFVRRSLPALLALVLGLLVAPQPASNALPGARTTAAAVNATTHPPTTAPVHSGHSAPALRRPAGPAAPLAPSVETGEHAAQILRTQFTAALLGSRAPPSALA